MRCNNCKKEIVKGLDPYWCIFDKRVVSKYGIKFYDEGRIFCLNCGNKIDE